MRNADLAMYSAKAAGKGRIHAYRPQGHNDEHPASSFLGQDSCIGVGKSQVR
jgi:hypothetical protein